jgi:hypothetical protein
MRQGPTLRFAPETDIRRAGLAAMNVPQRNEWQDRGMSDPPDDAAETPIKRALRLRRAATNAKPKPPRGGEFQRQQTAAPASESRNLG